MLMHKLKKSKIIKIQYPSHLSVPNSYRLFIAKVTCASLLTVLT